LQTFITDTPINRFGVANLDSKRLVKQLLEARQIMAALSTASKGWSSHPATLMWRGKEFLLVEYASCVVYEMLTRGYQWKANFEMLMVYYDMLENPGTRLFDDLELWRIIYTHRGRLYEKDPEHYAQWADMAVDFRDFVCCDNCDYYWPTHVRN